MSVPYSQSHFRPADRRAVKKAAVRVNFICIAPAAKKVTLIGDFNDWDPNAMPLKRQVDGSWTLQLILGHGDHHYQFLVDGKPTLDPRAQGTARNESDEKVSLLLVS